MCVKKNLRRGRRSSLGFAQLGLAYILHRSNSWGQVFELEPGKHAQAHLPSRAHGLQYPARDPPLTLILSSYILEANVR